MSQYKSFNPLISWGGVLLFPLYSLPWTLYRMYHLEKQAFVQFAFFMGLVGQLWPPVGDLFRYHQQYELYLGLDWSTFLMYATLEFDYFLSFVMYGLGILNIPSDISRFIFNFFGFYIYGRLFLDVINDNCMVFQGRTKKMMFVLFFLVSFSYFLSRFSLATVLFVYGSYHVVFKEEKRFWIFIFLSIICHFTFSIYAFIIIISKIIPIKFRSNTFYVPVILLILFGMLNLGTYFSLDIVGGDIIDRYDGYLDENDGGSYTKGFSLRLLIWQKFTFFVGLIYFCFFLQNREKTNGREMSFFNYLLLVCVFSSPFSLVFARFWAVAAVFFKVFLVLNYERTIKHISYLKLIYACAIISFMLSFWGERRQIQISDEKLLFTQTSFQIINHEYSDSWYNSNIGDGGSMLKFE